MTVPLPLLPLATPGPALPPGPAAPGADFMAIFLAAEQATEAGSPQTQAEAPGDPVPEPSPKASPKSKKSSPADILPVDCTAPQPPFPQPPDRPPLTAPGLPVAAERNADASAAPSATDLLAAEGGAERNLAIPDTAPARPDGVPTPATEDMAPAASQPARPAARTRNGAEGLPPIAVASMRPTPGAQTPARPGGNPPARRSVDPRSKADQRDETPAPERGADDSVPLAPAPARNPRPIELSLPAVLHAFAPAASSEPLPARPESVSRREAAPATKSHLAFGARLVAKPAEAVEAVPPGSRADHAARRAPDQEPAEAPRRVAHADAALDIPTGETPEPQPPAFAPVRESSSAECVERSEAPEKAAAPKPAGRAEPTAEAPRVSAVARDIRLEVGGGERRVEVRVIERAGEVQLAVRTPDQRLAGALRENLPLLSSRLEQSGWHADGWHAAEAGGPARRLEAPSSPPPSGGNPQQQGGGGREQRDPEPRPPRPEERNEPKEKGNRFEWLMESLR